MERPNCLLVHLGSEAENLMVKALLEAYDLKYQTTSRPCDEWPSLPAVYGYYGRKQPTLIGGYAELCDFVVGLDTPLNEA